MPRRYELPLSPKLEISSRASSSSPLSWRVRSPGSAGHPGQASCCLCLLSTLYFYLVLSCGSRGMAVADSPDAIVIESRLSDRPPQSQSASPVRTSSHTPLSDDDDDGNAPGKVARSRFAARFRLRRPTWRFTLAGRALALLAGEVAANAAIWIVAGIVFGTSEEKRGVLSLCVVAWTLGLRHALGKSLPLLTRFIRT